MPKVYTYTTRARTKHADRGNYRCGKCGKDILPGEKRYEWSFRYGGTYRQHVTCGYPTRGQLTQSKMGQVYDVLDAPWGDTQEEIAANLHEAAEIVTQVAEEYSEAAQAFRGAGENADRAYELEAFSSSLEQAGGEVEQAEREGEESEEDLIERCREIAENAAAECPY